MTLERRIADVFRLNDDAWARHANPWSGWLRFATVLPLLLLAFWSRVWLGWWSLVPIALALAWMALNPHVFPPVSDDRPWIARGVFGERLWANRRELLRDEPPSTFPHLLNGLAALGGLLTAWGVVRLEVEPTVLGAAFVIGGKLAYIGWMARLYDRVAARRRELRYRGPASEPRRS